MRTLTSSEIQSVSAGISLFYPALFVGQVVVGGATAYGTLSKVKGVFMSVTGAQTIVTLLTAEIFGIPLGAILTTASGSVAGYYAYYVIAAI